MRTRGWLQMALLACGAWALADAPAAAWTRAGHMVSAAIAYNELAAHDTKVIDRIIQIMAHHPEPGPFEVAVGRTTGTDRTQRIFMEMARWSDDVRGGAQDHPSWHAAIRPVIDPTDPPAQRDRKSVV